MARTAELDALIAKLVPVTDEMAINALNDDLANVNSQIQGFQSARDQHINQLNTEYNENVTPLAARKEELTAALAELTAPVENPVLEEPAGEQVG